MADTDMDGLKPLATALTSVKGVGARTAIQICKNTGFDPYSLAGFLDTDQQEHSHKWDHAVYRATSKQRAGLDIRAWTDTFSAR